MGRASAIDGYRRFDRSKLALPETQNERTYHPPRVRRPVVPKDANPNSHSVSENRFGRRTKKRDWLQSHAEISPHVSSHGELVNILSPACAIVGFITRRARLQNIPPPPLKRWSARLVHRAQAPGQRCRVRAESKVGVYRAFSRGLLNFAHDAPVQAVVAHAARDQRFGGCRPGRRDRT